MIQPTILAALGAMEITLIVLVVLLLFGGKKIPELMRGLGKGMKEFKDGKDGVDGVDNNTNTTSNENKPL